MEVWQYLNKQDYLKGKEHLCIFTIFKMKHFIVLEGEYYFQVGEDKYYLNVGESIFCRDQFPMHGHKSLKKEK